VILQTTLNGAAVRLELEGDELLLDVLRERGLRSVRLGCGVGLCGSCTVLLDGAPVSSCLLLAGLAEGRALTTVEGLDPDDPVLRAFDELRAYQCGYCTPGMVLAARALLARERRPGPQPVREWMNGNLCRCGSYGRIEQAIARASEEVEPSVS
jgi:aerobic-type carbon monoxide dehydrogenase small subunit (CoxS/CutS family)